MIAAIAARVALGEGTELPRKDRHEIAALMREREGALKESRPGLSAPACLLIGQIKSIHFKRLIRNHLRRDGGGRCQQHACSLSVTETAQITIAAAAQRQSGDRRSALSVPSASVHTLI